MRPHLAIEAVGTRCYRLVWLFEDNTGGYLGQSLDDGRGEAPIDLEDREHWVACKAIVESPKLLYEQDSIGFFWKSEKYARWALGIANAALKATEQDTPMPDWAKTALENGWKMPRGWKP